MSSQGALYRANDYALRMLARRDVIALNDGRVTLLHGAAATRVADYLASARSGPKDKLTVRIERRSSDRVCILQVSPHVEQRTGGATNPFLMEIFEPAPRLDLKQRVLQAAYGLTPAEARVLGELARSGRLVSVAAQLGLTHNTIHAHAKQIFRKLGVSSQAQLMQLLASGPRA